MLTIVFTDHSAVDARLGKGKRFRFRPFLLEEVLPFIYAGCVFISPLVGSCQRYDLGECRRAALLLRATRGTITSIPCHKAHVRIYLLEGMEWSTVVRALRWEYIKEMQRTARCSRSSGAAKGEFAALDRRGIVRPFRHSIRRTNKSLVLTKCDRLGRTGVWFPRSHHHRRRQTAGPWYVRVQVAVVRVARLVLLFLALAAVSME